MRFFTLSLAVVGAFTLVPYAQSQKISDARTCPASYTAHPDDRGITWCMDASGRSYSPADAEYTISHASDSASQSWQDQRVGDAASQARVLPVESYKAAEARRLQAYLSSEQYRRRLLRISTSIRIIATKNSCDFSQPNLLSPEQELLRAESAYRRGAYRRAVCGFAESAVTGNLEAIDWFGIISAQGQGVDQDSHVAVQAFRFTEAAGSVAGKYLRMQADDPYVSPYAEDLKKLLSLTSEGKRILKAGQDIPRSSETDETTDNDELPGW